MYESQKRANQRYRDRNREKTQFDLLARNARNFIKPKAGTKAELYINWGNEQGKYVPILKELQAAINEKLQELDK